MYSGHVCVYYASMLRCWHLVWILVRTDHPCLGVGCNIFFPLWRSARSSPSPLPLAAGPPSRPLPPRRSRPPLERRRGGCSPPPHRCPTSTVSPTINPIAQRSHLFAVVLGPSTLPRPVHRRAPCRRATAPPRSRAPRGDRAQCVAPASRAVRPVGLGRFCPGAACHRAA
jgi:hypothetical protein